MNNPYRWASRWSAFFAPLLLVHGTRAQNLVPNGGFEEYSACPDYSGGIEDVVHWFDPSVDGTPDYFHPCAVPWFTVPDNFQGQRAAYEGAAYTGIFLYMYLGGDIREYLEVGLTDTLLAGQCYHFSMRTALSNVSQQTTDDLGVYFSADSVLLPDALSPGFLPQLTMPQGTYLNKGAWSEVQGDFIAAGGERFLMIGNFLPYAQMTLLPDTGGLGDLVYCYVDMVVLEPCAPLQLDGVPGDAPVIAWPAPFSEVLNVSVRGATDPIRWEVYDMVGRSMFSTRAASAVIATEEWAPGAYVILGVGSHGQRYHQRVIRSR